MEPSNNTEVKVESSTNDAGQHQEDDKRETHTGGERFGGRGRGGRGVSRYSCRRNIFKGIFIAYPYL